MVRSYLSFAILIASVGMLAVAACGDVGTVIPGPVADVVPDIPDTPTGPDWSSSAETNDWRVMFNYRGRITGTNTNQNELWIMEPGGQAKTSITNFSDEDSIDGDLSCNYGCVVSPDLLWLAVVVAPPESAGFTLKIGKINPDLEVKIVKGAIFTDIIDFKFAGTRLFYSKINNCSGPSCQYDIFMRDLEVGVNEEIHLMTFPPAFDVEDSIYKGHFRTGPNGKSVVLLNPTIRSVAIYLWKEGSGLVELDFICKFGTKGNCSGTGSEYSDTDPAAISNNGRWVAVFTFSERWQRVRLYDAEAPGSATLSIAASVPSGSYTQHVCDTNVLKDWQWQSVYGDPVFTPDDSEVIFSTLTDCPVDDEVACPVAQDCYSKKPRTNLRRVKLASLQQGISLTEVDSFNITQNPKGDIVDNRTVTGFVVSPDGATVIFTGTPTLDQNGDELMDGSSRQRNDREVYRIRLDGEQLDQISNDLSWQAESPRVAPPQ
jgi:hypothetical protein